MEEWRRLYGESAGPPSEPTTVNCKRGKVPTRPKRRQHSEPAHPGAAEPLGGEGALPRGRDAVTLRKDERRGQMKRVTLGSGESSGPG